MSPNDESILDEAARILAGDRAAAYGDPTTMCQRIADLWRPILETAVTAKAGALALEPRHVALCLLQLKVAREVNAPKRDNRVDMAGYAAILDRVTPKDTSTTTARAAEAASTPPTASVLGRSITVGSAVEFRHWIDDKWRLGIVTSIAHFQEAPAMVEIVEVGPAGRSAPVDRFVNVPENRVHAATFTGSKITPGQTYVFIEEFDADGNAMYRLSEGTLVSIEIPDPRNPSRAIYGMRPKEDDRRTVYVPKDRIIRQIEEEK